jgi:hypothetical protein
MNESVLEKRDIATRPYSRKELLLNRGYLLQTLRVGSVKISHSDCSHYYYTKINSKKENESKENNGCVEGHCSVCWKLRKTPRALRTSAEALVRDYMRTDPARFNPPESYEMMTLEGDFYVWLYNEFNVPIPPKGANPT